MEIVAYKEGWCEGEINRNEVKGERTVDETSETEMDGF